MDPADAWQDVCMEEEVECYGMEEVLTCWLEGSLQLEESVWVLDVRVNPLLLAELHY